MKPYPKDIRSVCVRYVPDSPYATPCLFPECTCDGTPTQNVDEYFAEARGYRPSPFREYMKSVAVAIAGTVIGGALIELVRGIFR